MSEATTVQYRVLGPLLVQEAGSPIPLGGPKQRLVLALMLLQPGRVVHLDRIIDGVWEDTPPRGAAHNIQGYVSELRRVLPDAITFEAGGYRLHVDHARIDAGRFESLLEAAQHASGQPDMAGSILREALAMWRGDPFADLRYAEALQVEIGRLEDMRLSALELRIEADLALGRHRQLVDELQALTREHPFHERFWAQSMLAFHRSGRRAEALRAFERARRELAEELGAEPSPQLSELARRILEADPNLVPAARPPAVEGRSAPSVRGFELRERIGAGRAGEVFAAYQASLGREVAVKVLRPDIADGPAFIARFDEVTRRVAHLEHPYIVPLLDAWRDPGGAYLVMPLLSGGDLETSLADGAWQLPAALRVVDQIGSALAYAHRSGIAHGDLDATDVLLDAEGNAFVGDLGLAECVASGTGRGGTARAHAGADRHGQNGHELRGDGREPAIGPDLAGLGWLTYRLLTGLPVGRDLDGDVSRLRPEVPREVDRLLRQAVSDDPAVAPPSVDIYLRDLRRAFGVDTVGVTIGESDEVRDPYKGLRAFDEGDASDFFGRTAAVGLALDRLSERRFVAVVGSSGGGKSSLVRAGVVPALRAAALPGSDEWLVSTMIPGPYPFEELARALRKVAVADDEAALDELEASSEGLERLAGRLLPPDAELLLVIDQLEELFSMVDDADLRSRFLASLARAAHPGGRIRILATARSDFFDRFLDEPVLGGPMQDGLVLLSPLSPDELTLAITAPARRAGLRLEEGLAERIVADVSGRPGALPLVQHALTELVRARRGRTLTLEAYQAAGGALGALGNRAEQVYGSLDDAARSAVRDVLLRLITIDEGGTPVRRRTALAELANLRLARRDLDEVLGTFGAYRLLTFDRDPVSRGPTVEVAHEALFSQWSRLAGWVDTYRDGLVLQRRLASAAAEWQAAGRDPSYALAGGRLAEFEAWAAGTEIPLSSAERDYLDTSRAHVAAAARTAGRRRRIALGTLMALTIFAVVFGAFGFVSAQNADRERAGSLVLALIGRSEGSADEDPDLPILLAAEAVELARSVRPDLLDPAEERLHRSLIDDRLVRTFEGEGEIAWSPDSRRLAFITDFGDDVRPSGILVVDIATGQVVRFLDAPSGTTTHDLAWSPDGRHIVATYLAYDPSAPNPWEPEANPARSIIWDVHSGRKVAKLPETLGVRLKGPEYSADGRRLTVTDSDSLVVWERRRLPWWWHRLPWQRSEWWDTRVERRDRQPEAAFGLPAFDPAGKRLAVGRPDRQVVTLLRADSGERLRTFGLVAGRGGVVDVAWSPDGRSLAALSHTGGGTVFDLLGETPPVKFGGRGDGHELEWSPNGDEIAIVGQAGAISLWDPRTGLQVDELPGHSTEITGLAWSPDGRWLASAGRDGLIRVWEPHGVGIELALFDSGEAWIQGAAWIQGEAGTAGDQIVVGHGLDDGIVRAWGRDGGPPVAEVQGLLGGILPVVASPDGVHVAFRDQDGSTVLAVARTLEKVWSVPASTPSSFSSDGRYLALTGSESRIVDTVTGETAARIPVGSGEGFSAVEFLKGDRWVLLVAADDVVQLWDRQSGAVLTLDEHAGGMTVVSPDRTHFAIGGDGRSQPGARVWDATAFLDGSALQPEVVRDLPLVAISALGAFTPDNAQLISGFLDYEVTFWDLRSGEAVRHIQSDRGVGHIEVSRDGRHLLVAGAPTRVYTLDTDELLAIAREHATRGLRDEECRAYLHVDACPDRRDRA